MLGTAVWGAAALITLCLLGAAIAGGSGPAAASAPAQNPTGSHVSTAQTASLGHVSPMAKAPSPGIKRYQAVPGKQFHPRGGKSANSPFFRGGLRSVAASAGAPAPAPHTVRTAVSTPVVYAGVNKPGIAASDNPGPETPPDSTGAIGPNNYVEIANSVIHVWDRSLNSVSSMQLWNFIGAPNSTYPLCDVQVQWDQAAGRWLMSFLFCNTTSSSQGLYVAWSLTSDPSNLANGWCIQGVQTSPYILDFPKLGHNSNWVIVGGNFYDETNPSGNPPFVSAAMLWAPLPAAGDTSCVPTGFFSTNLSPPLTNGNGTDAFTPVPVNTTSGAGDGYVVSAYDAGGNVIPSPTANTPTPQSTLAVWHVTATGGLVKDPDITVSTYSRPTAAPQKGSTVTLDTLDSRLTQAVGDPVTGIWTQHTVAGGSGAMVTWYELALAGGSLKLVQQGNISSVTEDVFNAAISPSYSARGVAIEYNKSSFTTLPSIAAQIRINSTPTGQMEPGELSLATSAAPDSETLSCNVPTGAPCRWGDYSGASPDPVNPYLVWGTNAIVTSSSTSPSWQDENFALVAAIPPAAPGNVSGTSGEDAFTCVTWTPTNADPGAPTTSYTIRAYNGASVAATAIVSAPATRGCVNGLSDGTAYTITVAATDLAGTGAESAPSAPVTPQRGAASTSGGSAPSRSPVSQSSPAPSPPSR